MNAPRISALVILVAAFSLPLHAQEELSLKATLTRVLDANLRLQASELDHRMAVERSKAEWSIFEPVLLVTLAREANNRENSTERFLSQRVSVFDEHNTIYSAAVEGTLPSGGNLRLGSQARGLDNNLQVTGRREWESFTGATLTQPLLKSRGWKAVSSQIRIAAADSEVALQDYRSQLALVLSEAEMAYWDLAAAVAFVDMSKGSVDTAEVILKDTQARLDAGKATELDVLQAEAGLALRISNQADADQSKLDAASRLDAFLGRRADSSGSVSPTDELELQETAPALYDALAESFRSHPAYLAQTKRIEQAGIRVAYAKNERLPQLDLKASYGLNGLAGTLKGTLDESVLNNEFPSWYAGLELRYPIFDSKRERHQLNAAKMREQQALLELSAIEIELMNGIHVLVEKVSSLGGRASALDRVVDLHERVLENEREYLSAGKSEIRKVLEVEEDLSEARAEALAAMLEQQRARVALLVQQGSYLRARGFEIDLDDSQGSGEG